MQLSRWLIVPILALLSACTAFNQMQDDYLGQMQGDADADVVFVRAVATGDETWTFHVTVQHPDTGWEDYADGWDVVLPDGTPFLVNEDDPFTRLLLHPHTAEPFTRSQSNIIIPADVTTVRVRAHDLVDGWGGQEITVDLSHSEGDGYIVER